MHLKYSDLPLPNDLWTTPVRMGSMRITDPAPCPGSTEWDFDLAIALVRHQTALADHLESHSADIHGEREHVEVPSLGYFEDAFRYLARRIEDPVDGRDSLASNSGYQRPGNPQPNERNLERIKPVLPTVQTTQVSQARHKDPQTKLELGHVGNSLLNAENALPGRELAENSQKSPKKLKRKPRAQGAGAFGRSERHSPYASAVKNVSENRRKVIQNATGLLEPQQGLQAKEKQEKHSQEKSSPHACGKIANGHANGLPSVSEGGTRLSLSEQEKQLRIKQMLYGDSPPTLHTGGNISHFLVPSQVMPTERNIQGGIHVFVDISNVSFLCM